MMDRKLSLDIKAMTLSAPQIPYVQKCSMCSFILVIRLSSKWWASGLDWHLPIKPPVAGGSYLGTPTYPVPAQQEIHG